MFPNMTAPSEAYDVYIVVKNVADEKGPTQRFHNALNFTIFSLKKW